MENPLERDWRAKRLLLIQILLISNVHKNSHLKDRNLKILHVSLFGTVLSISDNIMHYQWLISVFLKSMSRDQLLQKACYIYLGLNVLLRFSAWFQTGCRTIFFSFVVGFYAEILKQQLKSFIYLTLTCSSHKIYLPPELSLLLYCFLRYEVKRSVIFRFRISAN